jgi:hypothetical protein
MLGCDRYGFHIKLIGTQYAKYVFLHFSASRKCNVDALFFMLRKDRYGFHKSAPGHATPIL